MGTTVGEKRNRPVCALSCVVFRLRATKRKQAFASPSHPDSAARVLPHKPPEQDDRELASVRLHHTGVHRETAHDALLKNYANKRWKELCGANTNGPNSDGWWPTHNPESGQTTCHTGEWLMPWWWICVWAYTDGFEQLVSSRLQDALNGVSMLDRFERWTKRTGYIEANGIATIRNTFVGCYSWSNIRLLEPFVNNLNKNYKHLSAMK